MPYKLTITEFFLSNTYKEADHIFTHPHWGLYLYPTIAEVGIGGFPQRMFSARFYTIVTSGTNLGADEGWSARMSVEENLFLPL